MLRAINRDRYEVIPVGITAQGAFVLESDDPERFMLDPERLPVVHDNGTRVLWPESTATHELRVTTADGETESIGDIDVVFPILHGPFGEDGTVQGLLELLGLPFVGSGVLASSLGMHKHFTKTVLAGAGIPVAPWRSVSVREWAAAPSTVRADAARLGLPVFVKPARAGSSVGVSRVTAAGELDAALATAFAEDDVALIEAAVVGREVEIAVLGGAPGEQPRTSVAGEIVLSGADFYDFATKYLDAPGADLVCPAELGDARLAEFAELAVQVFDAIGAVGLARVDCFLTESGFVVNEANTMPGFTPISMFPRCWAESGLEYSQLIDELIRVGLAHGARVG